MATTVIIYGKEIKWIGVWIFKMGGVHVSNLCYINVFVFYRVEILDTKSLGFRDTHNNKIYIAIANEIVNCSSIQAFYKVCFTNYNFEVIFISLFVLICSLFYVLSLFKNNSSKIDKILHETNKNIYSTHFRFVADIVPFKVCDEYCIYFEKISQICNTHCKPNNDTMPILFWFMMDIAPIKIYDAPFQCVMSIASTLRK